MASLRKSSRYAQSSDAKLKALAMDMSVEAQALKEANKYGRLEMWWSGLVEKAKEAVRSEADQRGIEMGRAETERRAIEESLNRDGVPNGEGGRGDEVDEEGDVIME